MADIPVSFSQAEAQMQAYFEGAVKGYEVTVEGKVLAVEDQRSGYIADVDLENCSDFRFCTDPDIPMAGMIRFSYGEEEREMFFMADPQLQAEGEPNMISLVAMRKPLPEE